MTRVRDLAVAGTTVAAVVTSLLIGAQPAGAVGWGDPGIRAFASGAHYDPAKCTASSQYWHGARRFYLSTRTAYGCMVSPWFRGAHPVMVTFGPTSAPWYGAQGSHHGVDIDMPMGTPVYSAVGGTVRVRPSTLGVAYGSNRMLVRSAGRDYVLGHMSRLVVHDGQHVRSGQLLGYSGMSGVETEDGPHLHFEVRPAGTTYTHALDPWSSTHARRV